MRLKFDCRHGDDVFAFLEAVELRLSNFRMRRDVFNANDKLNRRQLERLCDFVNHVFRRADNQNSVRLYALNCVANLFGVTGQNENRTPYRHDSAFFGLRALARDNVSVFNQNAVVDNRVGVVFACDLQRPMTFARAAGADQCNHVQLNHIPEVQSCRNSSTQRFAARYFCCTCGLENSMSVSRCR